MIYLTLPRPPFYKVILTSKRYEVKTPSKVDMIKSSSSLCLMYPRLQYLMFFIILIFISANKEEDFVPPN